MWEREQVGREILHGREKEKASCSCMGLRGARGGGGGLYVQTYLISLAKTGPSQ